MIDYKLLEAFAMVVRTKRFDRAARKLHITQSAVSQRLRLLAVARQDSARDDRRPTTLLDRASTNDSAATRAERCSKRRGQSESVDG